MTIHPRTAHLLAAVGLTPRELAATEHPTLHAVPDRPDGFGLIGGTGVGKTWALVQALAEDLDARVMAHADPGTALRPAGYAAWLNWPQEAETLKGLVSRGQHEGVADRQEWWGSGARMLFLDDLGQERVTGENDLALGVLRTVLDMRYRLQLPVYWTSNLDLKALAQLYGARIVSRLVQAWPPVTLQGRDLRLAGVR